MKSSTKKIIIAEAFVILLGLGIFLTFAYFSIGAKQDLPNKFSSGCLSIEIINDSPAIDLKDAVAISDIDGLLQKDNYKFTIKNNCDKETNYQINLESLDKQDNTLKDEYLRVSLSSDTMDNLISTLSENDATKNYIDGSYISHKLYEGVLDAQEEKEYILKEWIEYNTTKEEGAEKTYKSRINVIATSGEVKESPEIKFNYSNGKVKGTIIGNANSITYCETKDNRCEPSESGNIEETGVTLTSGVKAATKTVGTALGNLEVNTSSRGMMCSKIDNGKTICSNPYQYDSTPVFGITSEQADKGGGVCTYDGNAVMNFMGGSVTEESCQKVYKVTMQGQIIYSDDLEPMIDMEFGQYYKGPGVWNESEKTCTYNGQQVLDMQQQPIKSEEKCGKVYNMEGSYVSFYVIDYFTMMGAEEVTLMGAGEYKEATGKTGIYETEDEEGTSYYYRGAVDNNYVDFAGFYWRIIRINGNGSIRLIYSGKKTEIDGTGQKDEILKNGYNDSSNRYTEIELSTGSKTGPYSGSGLYNDNAYVGFMYGDVGATTYAETHKNEHDSNAKKELDNWYTENLKEVEGKLDTQAGFCNDRSLGEGYSSTSSGYGTEYANYGAYDRIWNKRQPTLKCKNKTNDYFTWKNHATTGNQALDKPIGLITADEVMYAGGTGDTNYTYYLYNGTYYWTMSPGYFGGSTARVFSVSLGGDLYDSNVLDLSALRPVINVDPSKVKISGTGTIKDMYVFK